MRIAVLFGGDSMERDVSIASAAQVIQALRSREHEVWPVDASRGRLSAAEEALILTDRIDRQPPAPSRVENLPAIIAEAGLDQVDVVFLALHGGSGEDGSVQSLLDLLGVVYTGSGRLGSALAWDKGIAKQLFLRGQVPTPDWLIAPVTAEEVHVRLGFPVIVKPTGQGSTVGLTLVESSAGLDEAVRLAARFHADVMIERFIPGRELTVGVLEDQALAVGEIIPSAGSIFDYEAKYQPGAAQEVFPADVPPDIVAQVQALGLSAHRVLKLANYSRADFRMDPQGGLWCLEVNTLPGLSSGSLLPRSAAAVGIEFADLCERICRGALEHRGRGATKRQN